MDATSDRLALPLLATGQAQKELTHNEALARLDMLVQPVVEAVGFDTPPEAPEAGACWIAGSGASGAWAGHAGDLACWTAGGWRFVRAFPGMTVWSKADAALAVHEEGGWIVGEPTLRALRIGGLRVVGERQAPIPGPAGGGVVDAEARFAIEALLAALRGHGLIAA